MSTIYNEDQKQTLPSQKDATYSASLRQLIDTEQAFSPVPTVGGAEIGQKRTVSWLEDDREAKAPKIEVFEPMAPVIGSKIAVKPHHAQPQQMQVSQLTHQQQPRVPLPQINSTAAVTTATVTNGTSAFHAIATPTVLGTTTTATPRQPSYTTVYNDQFIIQHRINRPKLRLDDFFISRTLGTGSFGRVHLIQSKVNSRYYAMKVLKKTEVIRLKQVEHTNNEKHILEAVAHPFIVNMWGTFQDSNNLYIIQDYIPGGELFSILRRSQRFPDHVAKFYAAEVILAIEYLHSKDMIYRDLKPENLLLDAQGHIKITDFGFAKYVPDITWTLCGTPDYLAPEIIQSKGYGKAVDWWSLGVLIYEMLAGYPPFFDEDHLKLYEKILACKLKWPAYFEMNAKSLLKQLLTPDLTKRYGNLKGGSDDLKRHPWFAGVDFNRILARQIKAPYVPQIRGEGDASHFDKYPETQEPYGVNDQNDPYRHLFPDF
ncbi:kinase-like domain-containing protein [Mycotypha africana]|uniref:kinase-like domain-containing protein n=1 Tax=Mycotypha africana TaxID=64632 RepID=UPI002300F267|nr:kinase-like domain-containing protein [Mycotypha africana]KAI8977581.1 kinase-like domain-containing protein [Mycotypha africana]